MAKRVRVFGVPVDCVDMESARSKVREILMSSGLSAVVAVNPEKVIKAQNDPDLVSQIEASALANPDGIGVCWAVRLLHHESIQRVPGADLMLEICREASAQGRPVFLYGASPEVNSLVARRLPEIVPGLTVAGFRDGYTALEAAEVNASGAEVLFLALGSPKQENWMLNEGPKLENVRLCQGIGGTLDVLANRVARAPLWVQKMHLEWLFRLMQEPRRVRRQFALVVFAARVFGAWLRKEPQD